tara:strand:- start:160 stop:1176 length:1017 start_codon:yes stop_codon:yes gene_type:complete
MDQCIFSGEITKCKGKCKYGGYCYKHRRNHLVKDNNLVNIHLFTGLSKDYLKADLLYFSKHVLQKNHSKVDKQTLMNDIQEFINRYRDYETKIDSIIKIQSFIRRFLVNRRGNRLLCNNEEDFYTYELLSDIDPIYFYTYKDTKDIIWGFDIRSFHKLIELNYPNPYTTEEIPQYIIDDVKKKINELQQENKYEDLIDTIQRDRKECIKQKTVDIFSLIEQHGYTCQIDWLLSLGIRRLKELYKQLEDIWNYRSQLSEEAKRNICPPDGRVFTTPIIEVMNYNSKEDLQELILHDISKFTNCEVDADRRLGYMYFIIGLGQVSKDCYIAHSNWLAFIN